MTISLIESYQILNVKDAKVKGDVRLGGKVECRAHFWVVATRFKKHLSNVFDVIKINSSKFLVFLQNIFRSLLIVVSFC